MAWYDGIGAGIGSMVDMFSGAAPGSTAMGVQGIQAAMPGVQQAAGKASGLTPFMKMLGMTPAAAPPEDRMIKPSEQADLDAGRPQATAGSPTLRQAWDDRSKYSAPMEANRESNGFVRNKNPDGSNARTFEKLPAVNGWGGRGTSGGNRQSDIDARDKAVKMAPPEIYQPDLSKLTKENGATVNHEGQMSYAQAQEDNVARAKDGKAPINHSGGGAFTDSKYGAVTYSGIDGKMKTGANGKGNTTLVSAGAVAGGEYKTGYRKMSTSDSGNSHADAEAGFVASGGASASIGLDTKNGAYATAGAGGKIGLYGEANADAKTNAVKFGGQSYDAGIGVHGDAFVGAKAGLGGTIGLGPDFIGAKGNIGAFVGAEAAGDVHGNLGPLAGKVGASGMAGAGIGADGDISYKDGKFHIGGKMFACLGYGGSLSADATVDVGKIGRTAYDLGGKGLDLAGQGLNAAGEGLSNLGHGAMDMGSNAISGVGNAASNLWNW